MLSGASLEKKFQVEPIRTTCYLVNRSFPLALIDKTPMEIWSGKNPSLRNIQVFGCEAYVHVPKAKRSKLENNIVKCIFINYGIGVKGYKLWDLVAKRVLYSRSGIFRELNPSSVVLQPEKEEKKDDVVQLPSTPDKVEPKTSIGLDNEESSSSSESLEEDEEP